jgi:hypothetical protein
VNHNNINDDDTGSRNIHQHSSFSYPGVIFENYVFSWYGVMPHSRQYLKQMQDFWWKGSAMPSAASDTQTIMNGGDDFFKTSSPSDKLTYPLELPNVLILPLTAFEWQRKASAKSMQFPHLMTKTRNQNTTLFSHNKYPIDVCVDNKCWPFLVL